MSAYLFFAPGFAAATGAESVLLPSNGAAAALSSFLSRPRGARFLAGDPLKAGGGRPRRGGDSRGRGALPARGRCFGATLRLYAAVPHNGAQRF